MKTIFKVFGLEEKDITIDSWLSMEGIKAEKQSVTIRIHQADFDTELDALEFVCTKGPLRRPQFEHGFEIVKVFVLK